MGKNKNYGYITKETFETIKKHKFPLLLGSNLIIMSEIQLNFHKINSPTLPHSHSNSQIIYYVKGSGKEIIEEKEYEVSPGTIIFIPYNKKHSFFPIPNTTAEVFTIKFEIKRNIIRSKIKNKFFYLLKLLHTKKTKLWEIKGEQKEKYGKVEKKDKII